MWAVSSVPVGVCISALIDTVGSGQGSDVVQTLLCGRVCEDRECGVQLLSRECKNLQLARLQMALATDERHRSSWQVERDVVVCCVEGVRACGLTYLFS